MLPLFLLAILAAGLMAFGAAALFQAADDEETKDSEKVVCVDEQIRPTPCPAAIESPEPGRIQQWMGTAAGGATLMAAGGLQILGVLVAYKRGWAELVGSKPDATPGGAPDSSGRADPGVSLVQIMIRCLACGYVDSEDADFCSGCARPLKPATAAGQRFGGVRALFRRA